MGSGGPDLAVNQLSVTVVKCFPNVQPQKQGLTLLSISLFPSMDLAPALSS